MTTNALSLLDSIAGAAQQRTPSRTVRLATVDASYSGGVNGPCKVTFDGESSLTTRAFPCSGYAPVASDRVVMLPVGNTYVVIGALDEPGRALSSGAGEDINISAGASADVVISAGGQIQAQGLHVDSGSWYRSTDQSIGNNNQTQWTPNTEDWDTSLEGFTLSGGGLTVNEDGLYLIIAKIAWDGNASGYRRCLLKINGGTAVNGDNRSPESLTANMTNFCQHIAQMNDGDEVTIEVRQNCGTSLNVFGGTNDYTHSRLTIVRLGAKS